MGVIENLNHSLELTNKNLLSLKYIYYVVYHPKYFSLFIRKKSEQELRNIENIILAWRAIMSNSLITIITMSIIAVGITSLVGTLTAISVLSATINNSFSALGANSFTIRNNEMNFEGGGRRRVRNELINYDQAHDFKKRFEYPCDIAISYMCSFNAELYSGNKKTNPNISLWGIDDNYLKVSGFSIAYGRSFSELELQNAHNAIIIANGVVQKLFINAASALGKSITINNEPYNVIGVLESKGNSGFMNTNNIAMIPLEKARYIKSDFKPSYVISVGVKDAQALSAAKDEAAGVFRMSRDLRPDEEDNFAIQSADQITNSAMNQLQYVTIAATAIGLITLFGAGIGLMNIMLVSVTDRTREIGISKAIGATKMSVRVQYLTEAIMICILGGLMGIILGIIVGNLVGIILKGPFVVPWIWILLGLLFCFIMGIIAGFYPAHKASNLDPIEALRYE